MRNELPPLYYAIIKHFENGIEDTAQGVVDALSKDYTGYKLLTQKSVTEALATAKENGILEETSYSINEKNALDTCYRMTEFGESLASKYLH